VFLQSGEIKTFMLSQRYLGEVTGDEFFIEAFGDEGAYGHLDPNDWVAVEPFEGSDGADLNGESGGSGWSAAWSGNTAFDFETTGNHEGSSHVDNPTGDTNIVRLLTTSVDTGIVKVALNTTNVSAFSGFVEFEDGDFSNQFVVELLNDGTLTIRAATDVVIASSLSANTWYEGHFDFDATADTVRGRLVDDTVFSSTVSMASDSNIDRVRLLTRFGSTATFRVDDLGVGVGLAAAPGVNEIFIID